MQSNDQKERAKRDERTCLAVAVPLSLRRQHALRLPG